MNQKNQLSNFLFLSVSQMPISFFFQFLRCQTHLKSLWMCLLRSNFSQQVPQPPLSGQTFFCSKLVCVKIMTIQYPNPSFWQVIEGEITKSVFIRSTHLIVVVHHRLTMGLFHFLFRISCEFGDWNYFVIMVLNMFGS